MRSASWTARVGVALFAWFALAGCSGPQIGDGEANLLVVTVYDEKAPYYANGAAQEYELRLGDQKVEPDFNKTTGFNGFNDLPESDEYELIAAQRPCIDNCEHAQGERRDECRLDLEIDKPETVIVATWRAGKPCTFKEIDADDL
jgi:hypothetical protein